ncbi:PEP-CTERM sorting domain-containing protein [Roseateles asaccharophilus]|uniref:PEP-CTERM sorting domain-containing protein n=1 Tax=Roseateles asaccharophilus TaxID=582607 RepID=A0ABU2ACQ9_9BURK|nr:PEP-CTERM sorting domain-containing protein [Roseateles asaccharophilus]MDR7334378.1 hypothetical protein [Roseateles asaccharophilus]
MPFTRLVPALRHAGALLTLALAPLAHAAPVVVDFSNYASTGVHATVSSGGFDFSPAGGSLAVAFNGSSCSPTCAANGTTALAVGRPGLVPATVAPVTMSTAIYASFRLTGLDYAELSLNATDDWSASSLLLTGTLLGGGTISQLLAIDGANDGPGGDADFQAAVLDAIWGSSDLVSLQFTGFIGADSPHAFQLDNIGLDVSRVGRLPEPASLVLVGLALAAASQTRRLRRR